jgi:predicted outer membrane repeat protein
MDFDPKGLFYDLQGCGSGDYTYFRNIGSSYVFAPTYGLAALGLIRSDTLNEERRYYTQLSQGFCLGDTLLDWQRYTHEMFMAIIGDPLLVLPNATWVGEGHKPPHTPGVPVCDPLFGIIGDVGTSYEFTINTSDPGGNRIWYMVDWGDGTTWVSPLVPPGEPQTISHSWSESGVYRVRVRATDEDYANGAVGAMSGWSDPLVVTIANPEISVNPSSIQFQVEEGTPCDPQTLTIGNYGILPLEFTITNTSFEPLDEIDSPGESQRDGSGAVDHENNVYLVWSDSTGGYYQGYTGYVVYRTWTHSTQEWSMDNVILDELTCGDEYPCRTPSVAVDPAGNVHVVWTRYDGSMWYRKWDDSTQQWIPSLDDDPAYVGYGWMPSIATDSQGVVHMVWYRNGHVYYKNTVTWTGAGQIICTGSPYQPLLAVDAFDNLHVVWRYGANQLYHKLWDATERAWSTVQPVFNQSFTTVEEYSLDVDAYDNLHVVWLCKELNGTRNIYYSKWDSGTREWTPNTDLELITSITYGGVYWGQRYVSMAVDAKDNVYLLWLDKNPDYPNFPKLFYKVRVALLDSWTETMTPDEIGANRATVQPLLLADNLGTIHMLTLSGWEIYVTRALSPGIDWLSMELVSGVVDPGGNVAVNLSVDTTGLAKGLYRVYLVLESNDVSDPMIKVPVNLTVLSSVPAAPQVCVSWWGDNYVNLSWINVTRTEDGFPLRDLAGFRVYRNVTGSWSAFEQRAEVAAPATFYHETGLAPGLFYYYRVTAVDASGHESGYAVCEKLRRGDMNHDGKITIIDVVYLTNYLFIGGPAPLPLAAGDASNDGKVNVNDVVFLTNYLFINGPPPVYQELPDMLPRADAGSDQMVHIDNEVIFDGSDSHDPDGTIVSYVWDFGDDSLPSPGMITTHTYADNRTYTVTLTVTDNLGGTDTDTCCVQVLPWVLHVPDDLDSIQTAIAIAFDGQTILVAPGTYRETLDFLGKAVTVQSTGGPEITVIDGGQCWSVVTFDSGETSSSVLDGFTITNGNALYGAGIYCGHGSSPTIRNNDIVFNVATEGGGFFCDSLSSPVLSNNNITQNTAVTSGGGIYCSGIATITNNNISSNTLIGSNGYGGGIYCSAAATITNNNISSNTVNFCGGGIYCSAAALITNNIISNNQVVNYHSAFLYGGGIYCSGSATITNNIILNNHMTVSSSISSRGGGIYCDQSVTITNNIISKNAAKSGGGIYCNSGSPTIINNIISDNTHGPLAHGGGIYCQVDSSPSITYCDVWDNQDNYYQCSPGIGCIEANPLFINHPLWGPYYLGSGSPCIDAGDPSTNYNDIEDPNNPGFALPPSQGTLRNDMGCYGGPTPLLYSLLLD